MTEKANPSINRPIEAFQTAGAIAYGGSDEGFISPANSPTPLSVQDQGINEAQLNAFDETSSSSSLDVTIDGGEAFVFGSWLVIDTQTTVSLAPSTSGQTVSVGWNKNGADDVIVGLDAAFSSASGDADQKIPLFTFDTDATGVTAVTDERSFDQISADSIEQGAGSGLDADTLDGTELADIAGGYSTAVTKTADDTAIDRQVVLADATSNNINITLPSPTDGQLVTVKKIDSSNNAVNILTPGAETIDGQTSISITGQFAARETVSNGTDYFII